MADAVAEEKRALLDALKRGGYVLAEAGRLLGVDRSTVLRRVRRHGLADHVAEQNPDLAERRARRDLPPAPHEPSRQALHQQENRARGLCGCGKPPGVKENGEPAKQCSACLVTGRRSKARAAGRVVSA